MQYIYYTSKLILLNEGSLTQNINSITGKKIFIDLIEQKLQYNNQVIRKIWIQDNYSKFIFAKSFWKTIKTQIKEIINKEAIGQNIILQEIDNYKKIHKLDYSYCYDLEYYFNKNTLFWSREYTIFCNNEPVINIQELLSHYFNSFLHL